MKPSLLPLISPPMALKMCIRDRVYTIPLAKELDSLLALDISEKMKEICLEKAKAAGVDVYKRQVPDTLLTDRSANTRNRVFKGGLSTILCDFQYLFCFLGIAINDIHCSVSA